MVSRYRAADPNGKQNVITELLEAGPTGYRTLLKIAGAEEDPAVRGRLLKLVTDQLSRTAPQMLVEGNYDTLELLLDVLLANDPDQGAGHYAAYYLMRGKLDERITHFKALAGKGPDGKRSWEILAHLYHAKGDLAAARDAADKAERPELADAMLFEAGDWKELARRPVHTELGLPYESLGFQAAYRRLAGDARGSEDSLADLRKLTDAAPGDEEERFYLAKAYLLNDRPQDGLDVLVNTPGRQAAAYELLAARMDYKAAFALADKAKAANAPEAPTLEILKARTLYLLGEKDKALSIFARYGDDIKDGADFSWFQTLIEAELKVGLNDRAAEHAARVLGASHDMGLPGRLFPKLFPKNAEAAEALWAVVHRPRADAAPEPPDAPLAAMKEVRGLLDGTADPKDLAALVKKTEDDVKTLPPEEADKRHRALAEAALAAKQEDLARSLLEQSGTATALVRLGDLSAEKKEWDKAEEYYSRAWDRDHGRPLALYLSGWALVQAGKDKEGKKRMELSHWTPLGDGDMRLTFARSLSERGRHDDARREAGLLLRLSTAGSFQSAEGMRQLGLEALENKDYAAAADGQERAMLRCLGGGVNYMQPVANLGVPAFVHRLRARGYTAAGKFDEAKREAGLGLADLPGDSFFPIELVPAWDKAGHKKEAAELYERCLAVQEKLCDAYPNCAWGHNSAAWISVCCRRDLDKAEEHALKAVALSPTSAGDLDTLAEIYFQRGEKDKAIAAQKKAIELAPTRPYFRKQLRRIEAGDPNAPRPPEDDEE